MSLRLWVVKRSKQPRHLANGTFAAASPGLKTETITVTGLSQDVQNGAFSLPVSYQVLATVLASDYNGNGVVDAADYTLWRFTLGQNVAISSGGPIGTATARLTPAITRCGRLTWAKPWARVPLL